MVASPRISARREIRLVQTAWSIVCCLLCLGFLPVGAASPQEEPLPPLAEPYGVSTPWCGGALHLDVDWSQTDGQTLTLYVSGAPPGVPLLLVAGIYQDFDGTVIDGVKAYVKLIPNATWLHLWTTDSDGCWQASFTLPKGGGKIYVQAATANGPDCPSIPFSASNALAVVLLDPALGSGVHSSAGASQQAPLDAMTGGEWREYKRQGIACLRVAPGWSDPQLLGDHINSIGWEDSASISPDGDRLYFSYLPADYLGLLTIGQGDLDQFWMFRRGPDRGNEPEYSFDTFICQLSKGVFTEPHRADISHHSVPSHASQTGAMERDGYVYFASNALALAGSGGPSIWRAGLGQEAMPLSIDSIGDEHDPSFLQGDLYFWSSLRPGSIGPGKRQIWLSRQLGFDQWSVPECLPEPINLADSDSWQPHPLPDGYLYFTSDRDGRLSIWKSMRLGPLDFGSPSQVVWFEPGGAVMGVAEPSLPDDGSAIYFCVLFRNEEGHYDLDIAVSLRAGP